MPQRISNDDLAQFIDMEGGPEQDALEFHLCCMLDLRDARQWLKLALEGLELVADQNDAAYPKQIARTYLDRIKGIG